MAETLIKVEGISKKFCRNLKTSLWYGLQDLGNEVLGNRHGGNGVLRKDEFWSVRDVSFELKRGECLGLIGPNGAGKSTLLKMLNGLIKPDEGRIEMHGRVGALIELGAGFNPILTGRENIYINGSVLGLTKEEIDQKFDGIVEFSGLGEFIDTPVQNYSSGMKVRLGFAVVAQIEPDVLIIDEVLAVGDIGFILKCLNWIDNVIERTAIIFVSHSMPMVSRICSDILLIDHGIGQYQGKDVGEGITNYLKGFDVGEKLVTFNQDNSSELIEAHVYGAEEGSLPSVKRLDNLDIKFVFNVSARIKSPVISLFFMDKEQRPIATCINSAINETSRITNIGEVTRYEVSLRLKRVQFSSGCYSVTFGLSENLDKKPLLRVRNSIKFNIVSDRYIWQPFELEGDWTKEMWRQ
jgi:lipopolysaccharide transport system ATP-binding protein